MDVSLTNALNVSLHTSDSSLSCCYEIAEYIEQDIFQDINRKDKTRQEIICKKYQGPCKIRFYCQIFYSTGCNQMKMKKKHYSQRVEFGNILAPLLCLICLLVCSVFECLTK